MPFTKRQMGKVKIPNYYPMDNKEASYETSCDAMMKHLSPSIYMWYWQAWLNHEGKIINHLSSFSFFLV